MSTWPSNASFALGRLLGRAYSIQFPGIYIFKLGNLIALASIPIALVLFFLRIAPVVGKRYTLTNRRIVVQRGLTSREDKSIDLDKFNRIVIDVRPGQAWYHAGDLIFYQQEVERFRLEGVSRPEAFRASCLKSQSSYVGVKQARQREAAV
jgi:hypothetical protein